MRERSGPAPPPPTTPVRMSVNNGALAQDQKHQDDYEFYTPLGSKEEQSTGKGFLVGLQITSANKQKSQLNNCSLYLVSWCCTWSDGCWLHGQKLQEQTEGHEDFSLPHPHQVISPGNCDRYGWSCLISRNLTNTLCRSSLPRNDESDVSEVEQEEGTVTQRFTTYN